MKIKTEEATLQRLYNILTEEVEGEIEREQKGAISTKELLTVLDNLRLAAYWVVKGGEFAHWVDDKLMPYAACKELYDLQDAMEAANRLLTRYKETQQ